MSNDFKIIEEKYFEKRGNIYTIFDQRKIPQNISFVQDKISKSFQGVIRGFHGDGITWKLIACLQGKVKLITYSVDTGQKNIYYIDGDEPLNASILIPPRTLNAHQCLSNTCIFYYKWSEFYTKPEEQWSVFFDDPQIDPEWDQNFHQIISNRDMNSPSLEELKNNVRS